MKALLALLIVSCHVLCVEAAAATKIKCPTCVMKNANAYLNQAKIAKDIECNTTTTVATTTTSNTTSSTTTSSTAPPGKRARREGEDTTTTTTPAPPTCAFDMDAAKAAAWVTVKSIIGATIVEGLMDCNVPDPTQDEKECAATSNSYCGEMDISLELMTGKPAYNLTIKQCLAAFTAPVGTDESAKCLANATVCTAQNTAFTAALTAGGVTDVAITGPAATACAMFDCCDMKGGKCSGPPSPPKSFRTNFALNKEWSDDYSNLTKGSGLALKEEVETNVNGNLISSPGFIEAKVTKFNKVAGTSRKRASDGVEAETNLYYQHDSAATTASVKTAVTAYVANSDLVTKMNGDIMDTSTRASAVKQAMSGVLAMICLMAINRL